ncbi:hypothetical protein [Xanthomonas citri]|uniref:hypothetical protein n=1 Tax=Xanthomonas citri TaxID=346 RepID=UPI003CCEC0C4
MKKKTDGPVQIGDLLRLPAGVTKMAAAVSKTTGSGKAAASRKPLSKRDTALIEHASKIATSQPTGEDMAFNTRCCARSGCLARRSRGGNLCVSPARHG